MGSLSGVSGLLRRENSKRPLLQKSSRYERKPATFSHPGILIQPVLQVLAHSIS